jgi:ornithine cyclodeaminase/alanine dehydrogenase-like protein (mu-crystallin family)
MSLVTSKMDSSYTEVTQNTQPILLLTDSDVRKALSMSDAIEAMSRGFADLSSGEADVPVRTYIPLDRFDGNALFMPAYSAGDEAFAVKIASIHGGNRALGLDAVQALVILFDATNGNPLAILGGKSITAIRTGAGSGLATRYLSRLDSKVAVIFGSGVQARTHLEAVCCVRDIELAYCIGRSQANAQSFAADMSDTLGIEVIATDDTGVVAEADVICTTTTANDPIIMRDMLKDGVHINAVGTHRPEAAEVSADIVLVSKVVVDQREACLKEAGDIILPIRAGLISEDHIFAELGEIAAGVKPGRETENEITLFKSVGNAIQDLAAANEAVKNAHRLGLGTALDI